MPRAKPGDYPQYWQTKLGQITPLVKQAYEQGVSDPLDVGDLKDVGERRPGGWAGKVVISSEIIKKGGLIYLRRLGEVLRDSGSLQVYGGTEFEISVGNDMILQVRRLSDRDVFHTKTELSQPFSRIFVDRDEAEWAFDFLRDTLLGLGVVDPDDPRFAITMRYGNRALRLNFGNWAFVQFYAPDFRDYRCGITLIDELAPKEGEYVTWEPFTTPDSVVVRGYEMPIESIRYMTLALQDAYEQTLDYTRDRFSSWSRSNLRRHNIDNIAAAIFDTERLNHLLSTGLNEAVVTQDNHIWWVNQGRSYDAAREGGYIWAPLESKRGASYYYWDSLEDVQDGDIILHYANTAIRAVSRVTTPAILASLPIDEGEGNRVDEGRLVKCAYDDLEPPLSIDQFREALQDVDIDQGPLNMEARIKQGYLFSLGQEGLNAIVASNPGAGWPNYILSLVDQDPRPIQPVFPSHSIHPNYGLSDCATETGFDEILLNRWVRAIEHKKQVILYGPPGTGKTFIAERLARCLVGGGDGEVQLVQFHPAYAYEDFIQGIRPQARADGTLTYELVPGRFMDFCREARQRQGLSVLIIDEINRTNLSRVFGELMYLLEYRDKTVPLAAGGTFSIPNQVRIIGTMNTADRSIALVDHALRRRFAFLVVRPNYDILRRFHQTHQTGFPVDALVGELQRLNRTIDDINYEVGITFFLHRDLRERFADIWEMEIEPYLEEYFFDRPNQVSEFRWEKVKSRVLP